MIPDHLSADKNSPYFSAHVEPLRISVNGVEYTGRVLEYCISKGWAKIITADPATGKWLTSVRGGRPSCKMKHGKVTVWREIDAIPDGAIANTTMEHAI